MIYVSDLLNRARNYPAVFKRFRVAVVSASSECIAKVEDWVLTKVRPAITAD